MIESEDREQQWIAANAGTDASTISAADAKPSTNCSLRHRLSPFHLCVAGLLLTLATGCGSKAPWEKVVPVSGTIKFKGQPIPGALVILVPKDKEVPDKIRPTGVADGSGDFELATYSEADGAPEGDYDVVVTWHPLVDNGGSPSRGPNQLPEKYSKVETSLLTVHIDAGETELKPIDLTD